MDKPTPGHPRDDVRPIAVDTLVAAAFMTALYFAFDALAQLLLG